MTQSEVVLDELRHHPRVALFITLTCGEEVTATAAQHALNNFWRRLKRAGYPVEEYVVAREWQKRGVPHYHVLLCTSAYIPNDAVIAAAWRLGYTKTMRVDAGRATYYVSKYLAKGEGATLHSSVAIRVRYNGAEVSRWWHHIGNACWRYSIRMLRACQVVKDDPAALAVISRSIWSQVWQSNRSPAIVGGYA